MTTLEKCKKKGTDGIEREGIINPETKKCVFIDGALGKKLLKQYENQEKEKQEKQKVDKKSDVKNEMIKSDVKNEMIKSDVKSEIKKVENKKEDTPDVVRLTLNNFIFKPKIAAFDYDQTLVKPKSTAPFPKDENDWELLHDNIPQIFKYLIDNDYAIVIFTNQSKPWKINHIKNSLSSLNYPLYINCAYKKELHKPNPFMFTSFLDLYSGNFDKNSSFFVGDALGRKGDFSDSDKVFAENIGIKIYSPEEFFDSLKSVEKIIKLDSDKIDKSVVEKSQEISQEKSPAKSPAKSIELNKIEKLIPKNEKQEGIILVGFPGSGKSTIANEILSKKWNYEVLSGDLLITSKKMISTAKKHIKNGKSVVFDATNPSKNKRKEYIDFLKENKLPCRIIWTDVKMEEAMKRAEQREKLTGKHIPKIAFYVYRKNFNEPNEECDSIIKIG